MATTAQKIEPADTDHGLKIRTGILPAQLIRDMVSTGEISPSGATEIEDNQVQPASIDLRLGEFAYPIDTSFLPGKDNTVMEKLAQLDENFDKFKIDLREGAALEKGRLYLIPLLEQLSLKPDMAGFANPKSSTGRLDILTRLITDHGRIFDQVATGYKGKLYIEVAPQTFSIVAKTGTRLNQLRFRRYQGNFVQFMSMKDWKELLDSGRIVNIAPDEKQLSVDKGMLRFTVDLLGSGEENAIIGWRARRHSPRVDLERRDYNPLDFWEPIRYRRHASLVLDPSEFYILMTKEAVAVPPEYAAEMMPYDTRAGEFRVHYAGFFDPGFGIDASGKAGGSRGVLEVRSHEVPFLLEHGQTVGWLRYERMLDVPQMLYGHEIASNYQGQSLKLAKQFLPLRD